MKMFEFDSRMEALGSLGDGPCDVRREPMLFRADERFARQRGGEITSAFLDRLPTDLGEPIIDSRVHMLMPGFYPCIPGWHHDDVPRERADGQPNYETPSYHAEHVMMLVNADVAPTEFAIGFVRLPDVPFGRRVYQVWDGMLNEHPGVTIHPVEDRVLVKFDDQAFHRGVPAVKRGWRFFIRASFGTLRVPTNEVRTQVQVYLPVVNQGW